MLYEYWTRKLLPGDHLAGAVCYCFIECDTFKSMSGKRGWAVPGVLQTWHLAFTPTISMVSSDQRISILLVWQSFGLSWKVPPLHRGTLTEPSGSAPWLRPSSPDHSSLMASQLLEKFQWFVFWHTLSAVEPYIDRRVSLQIMSNQLNLGGQTCNYISRMISGNRIHLSSILNITAEAVFTWFVVLLFF